MSRLEDYEGRSQVQLTLTVLGFTLSLGNEQPAPIEEPPQQLDREQLFKQWSFETMERSNTSCDVSFGFTHPDIEDGVDRWTP